FMKKLNTLLTFVLTAICIFTACSDDETKAPPFLEISKESVNFRQTANVSELEFKTNAETVEAIVGQAGSGWCDVSVLHNADTKLLKISVNENSEIDLRSTVVDINAGGIKKSVAVCQMGQRPTILISNKNFTLSHRDTTITLEVVSNCDFEIEHNAEWINKTELTKSMDSTMHSFKIDRHPGTEIRSQEIIFREKHDDAEAKVYIEQQNQEDYTGGDPSTITSDIMLTVARSRTSSFQNGEGIDKSHDGDKETIYHSSWNNAVTNYFPITLEYDFDNEPSIDYLIYYPRQSGSNGNFKEVEIWIATEENPTFIKALDHDFRGVGTAAKIELGQSYVKPTSVKFIIKSGAGDNVGFAACSEMEFYRKNPDAFDPLTIFTDEVCTELRTEVTQEMIDTISAPYFKTMAQYMFDDRYPRDFRIANYKAYRHPDIMAKVNKTSPYSLRDNPTGIHFKAGEEVVIMMGDTHGATVSLQVQNLAEGYGGNNYPLSKGLNKFTITNEGLGYIMYFSDTEQEEPVKIHIASGTVQGFYDPEKHDLAKWNQILNNATQPYIDVLGKFSHLTYPVESFKNYCSD
ncbi:MAG: discoidin domain-containing protein, partial [Tannerellaceae bacterium]